MKKSVSSRWHILLLCIFVCSAMGCSSGTANTEHGKEHSGVIAGPSQTKQPPGQTATKKQLLNGPVVYVALGASDAVGVGSNQPESRGYVSLLEKRLPKGSRFVNLGISGIHLHEALTQELPLALSTSPTLVTIWLVANDFVAGVPYDTYMRDLDTLLKQLRASTHALIVMANLPDLTHLPAFAHLSTAQKTIMVGAIQRWNAGIATAAAQYQVTLVNLYSYNSQLTTHPEYVSGDGFHPSDAGYAQLADYFWEAINTTENGQ